MLAVIPKHNVKYRGRSDSVMNDGDNIDEDTREKILADPFCEFLGIDLEVLGAGEARTTLTITDELLNFHGTPHGGALYSLADAAFAAASNAAGRTSVALETNMSYLEAVAVGDVITATARETHSSGRTATYEITMTDETDSRIASFRGRVYRVE